MKYTTCTYIQNSTACTIVIGYMCTIGAGRTYVCMRMHIIHRITFRTVAGPYLTNRNDSYQSSSRRIASHRAACVCIYVCTCTRMSLNIWGSSSRRFSRRDATRHAFSPTRDCSPLPYRIFRERLTSRKSWSSMTMTTATVEKKRKRRKRQKRRANDDVGTEWSGAYTGGKSEREKECDQRDKPCGRHIR